MVIASPMGFTTRLRVAVAVCGVGAAESVTVIATGNAPGTVGVPLISPVAELIAHSYRVAPPVAVTVAV